MARTGAAFLYVCTAVAVGIPLAQPIRGRTSPFEWSAHFSAQEQSRVRAGIPVVNVPDSSDSQIAMAAAIKADVTADRFIAWVRQSDRMYSGAFAPAGGRLSTPPRIEDFNRLAVSAADLESLRECKPGDCNVKLTAEEMTAIRRAIEGGGPNWRPAGVEAVRRMLVARATAFMAHGLKGLPVNHDHRKPVDLAAELRLIAAGPEGRSLAAGVHQHLEALPAAPAAESSMFWFKNAASGAREVINLTHVSVFRGPAPEDVIVSEVQVYASHYLESSVAYLVLTGEPPDRYLIYLRRAKVDVLRGMFGGIVRSLLERRVRADAPKLISELRKKLESGDPPATVASRR